MRELNQQAYEAEFLGAERGYGREAFKQALDIRKFEIDLYWKRATYFWTFIGAVFAGYAAIQTISNPVARETMSVVASGLGVVFSFAWYCVNRGSKQWQENWEFHVDLLEDKVVGPLYKAVLHRARPTTFWRRAEYLITGPGNFSVTKINQIVSVFVTANWVALLLHSLPPLRRDAPINGYYMFLVLAVIVACGLILGIGRSNASDQTGGGKVRGSTLSSSADAD